MEAEKIWDQHFEGWVIAGQIKRNAIPAMQEYAIYRMIQENKSILEMAKLHMDKRAVMIIQDRISELEDAIS